MSTLLQLPVLFSPIEGDAKKLKGPRRPKGSRAGLALLRFTAPTHLSLFYHVSRQYMIICTSIS